MVATKLEIVAMSGHVFRVLRVVDFSKRADYSEGEDDPHVILDVPRGSSSSVITQAWLLSDKQRGACGAGMG